MELNELDNSIHSDNEPGDNYLAWLQKSEEECPIQSDSERCNVFNPTKVPAETNGNYLQITSCSCYKVEDEKHLHGCEREAIPTDSHLQHPGNSGEANVSSMPYQIESLRDEQSIGSENKWTEKESNGINVIPTAAEMPKLPSFPSNELSKPSQLWQIEKKEIPPHEHSMQINQYEEEKDVTRSFLDNQRKRKQKKSIAVFSDNEKNLPKSVIRFLKKSISENERELLLQILHESTYDIDQQECLILIKSIYETKFKRKKPVETLKAISKEELGIKYLIGLYTVFKAKVQSHEMKHIPLAKEKPYADWLSREMVTLKNSLEQRKPL